LKISSKKIKGKKLVVSVLGAALLCVIHDAIIENTLVGDDDSTNTLRTFNLTKTFLYLKKNCY
jgi:hypothetical protein